MPETWHTDYTTPGWVRPTKGESPQSTEPPHVYHTIGTNPQWLGF